MNTTTITNEPGGVILKTTTFSHDNWNYPWLIAAVLVFALLAWGLRKIFWNKDSD
jgi:hypothetical protein